MEFNNSRCQWIQGNSSGELSLDRRSLGVLLTDAGTVKPVLYPITFYIDKYILVLVISDSKILFGQQATNMMK